MSPPFRHPLDSVIPLRRDPETLYFLYQIAFRLWESNVFDVRYSPYVTKTKKAWQETSVATRLSHRNWRSK